MEQNLGFSHREQSTSITFPLPLEGQKSLITHLLRGRNIHRKTWLTVVLILDPNHLPPSLPSCSYILKSSSLLSGEPGLPKPLSLLLQLSSTPLIHSSSSSLLPNPNCFLHNHFHVILLLLKKKKHFVPFLNFLLNSDLFLFSPQSNKERLFDTDCEKKFSQPGLHANGKCLSVVSLPHIGNCTTQFLGKQPSIQQNKLRRTQKNIFKKKYNALFPPEHFWEILCLTFWNEQNLTSHIFVCFCF